MGDRLRQALADGVVLGVKLGITLLVVAFVISWAAGDYLVTRGAATYLRTVTEVKDAKGQPLTRMDLIDLCIRDLVARQSAAAKDLAPPAPQKPPTK
jgi:hypothetical protein